MYSKNPGSIPQNGLWHGARVRINKKELEEGLKFPEKNY